ncbi:unnamed protein product, partial [Iphiclides podalirius]
MKRVNRICEPDVPERLVRGRGAAQRSGVRPCADPRALSRDLPRLALSRPIMFGNNQAGTSLAAGGGAQMRPSTDKYLQTCSCLRRPLLGPQKNSNIDSGNLVSDS